MAKPELDRRKISADALERLRATVVELFASGLFHEVGMREIARTAQVSPKTIYKYFGDKERLVYACIKKDMDGLSALLEASARETEGQEPIERIQAFCMRFTAFYLSHVQVAEIVFLNIPMRKWIADPDFIQIRQLSLLVQLLQEGQERGQVRTDADPAVLVNLVAGAAHRYIIALLELKRDPIEPEADALELCRLLWPLVAAPA